MWIIKFKRKIENQRGEIKQIFKQQIYPYLYTWYEIWQYQNKRKIEKLLEKERSIIRDIIKGSLNFLRITINKRHLSNTLKFWKKINFNIKFYIPVKLLFKLCVYRDLSIESYSMWTSVTCFFHWAKYFWGPSFSIAQYFFLFMVK